MIVTEIHLMPARLRARFLGLAPVERLYTAGLVMMAVWLLLAIVRAEVVVANFALYIMALFCASGLVLEVYREVAARLSAPYMKLATALCTVSAVALSAGTSAMLIAAATGQNPNHFKWALPILAPLSFIPVLGLFMMIVAGASLFPMLFLAMKATPSDRKGWVWIARVFGAVGLLCASGLLVSTPANANLAKVARYAVYWFDMYPDPACSPLEGDRVVRVNDDLVIIGSLTAEGPHFVRADCNLTAEVARLPPPPKS